MGRFRRSGSGGRKLGRWLAAGASIAGAALVAAGVTAVVSPGTGPWPFGHRQQSAGPPARVYLNATACLLTDPSGITSGAPGATAWRAMQTASLATHVMVSYLPDTGPADAGVMLTTLAQRKCGVIITTAAPVAKLIRAAKADRRQDFVLVTPSGAAGGAASANTVIVSPADAPARIDQAIRALASQAQPSREPS